jgi:hypothetical protein
LAFVSAVPGEAFNAVGSEGAKHGSASGPAEDVDFADVAGDLVGADAADDGVEAVPSSGGGADADSVAEVDDGFASAVFGDFDQRGAPFCQ